MKVWRQGDLYFAAVDEIPQAARRRHDGVLVHGEATGHSHRVAPSRHVQIFGTPPTPVAAGALFLHARGPASIVHEEHGTIQLPPGTYRVWQQRELRPAPLRRGRTAPASD